MQLREAITRFGTKANAPLLDFGAANDRDDPAWIRARPGKYQVGGAKQSAKAYAGGKSGIDHFYSAVNTHIRYSKKATLQFRERNESLRKLRKGADDPADVRIADPAVIELFTMPNPWQHWGEFLALILIDLFTVGNFFAAKQGADADGRRPVSLYRLPPEEVEIESTKSRHINKYIYTGGKDDVPFEPEQMVHIRLPNPHSPYAMTGVGVVQAAPHDFDIELGIQEAQRSFFDRGTILSGTIESDKNIPNPTRKKALREFSNLHAGASRWGGMAFLERGMRYRAVQANALEAGYEALSKMSRARVFELLAVPEVLAFVDFNTTQKGAIDDARRTFVEDVVGPALNDLATVLTSQITAGWGLRAEFDLAYVPPAETRVANAEKVATLPGIKVNQVLEAAGYPPLGPDEKDADSGEPIGDMVLNIPGPSTEAPGGLPDALSGSPGGRPADPNNRTAFDVAGARTTEQVNGRPASAADQARRARSTAPARATARTKALPGGLTPEDVFSGEVVELARAMADGD